MELKSIEERFAWAVLANLKECPNQQDMTILFDDFCRLEKECDAFINSIRPERLNPETP